MAKENRPDIPNGLFWTMVVVAVLTYPAKWCVDKLRGWVA